MYPQHFIVEGKYLGTAQRKLSIVHHEVQAPYSYAYFCPHCAELWARCPVEVPSGHAPFQVWSIPCRKHPIDSLRVPGSLFLEWDKTFNNCLPEGVLRWELDRHLDLYPQE